MLEIYTELADGTILNANCGFDGDSSVWVWMRDPEDPENDMAKLFAMFSDPERTRTITSHIRERVETLEGYTKLTTVQLDYKGAVHIQMKRG